MTLENPVIKDVGDIPKNKEEAYTKEVLNDFWIACVSREVSLLGRKEVLTGKAKFGITGDGKEVPQLAMAKVFKKGDFRSGYYRDQTFHFALNIASIENFFAQLYADTENDPFSGGRQMNNHFATPLTDENGEWLNHKESYNISSDVSCTAGQMARSLGLAFASKKYRESKTLHSSTNFSDKGNEVCFCTIGDASTSEGVFWETVNAACVTKVPLVISVWDDGYGISVPTKYQTAKSNISTILEGFRVNEKGEGMDIYTVNGWDYSAVCEVYEKAARKTRKEHIPALIHVKELTQPQGHSTSGSHERYKSKNRLEWEREHDCIRLMGLWMVENGIATEHEVLEIRRKAKAHAKECRDRAWAAYNIPIKKEKKELDSIYKAYLKLFPHDKKVLRHQKELKLLINPLYSELVQNGRHLYYAILGQDIEIFNKLKTWIKKAKNIGNQKYHTKLYSDTSKSALQVPTIQAVYSDSAPLKNGFEILNTYFDIILRKNPSFFAFGEDVGFIGDVNQGFAGLQEKYGEERVFDTGIREWTIIGQAIGMAMRGLRPVVEIQYLDYLIFALEPLMDDLATLRYRSNGIQKAPAIIRTRGHRLEGIWHAGSPLGMIINSCKGIYVLVPRNMTQAAGFYNIMLQSDDPAIIIECLNGYRLKERLPANIGEYTVPLGIPEVLQKGNDVTLVTYGSCVRVAMAGMQLLEQQNISVELIDIQTLIPFDIEHIILQSLKRTNRIVFMDEDVPGGATAYMMQEVLEKQGGYMYLDSPPVTLTATEHRPPYGSDGDYFSKPNPENVFETIYRLMYETEPGRFNSPL